MTARADSQDRPRVAVVLSGAGARGAFQAGALEVLVPALAAQGSRPTIWLGTSAGSINATLWAARAHLDPSHAATEVVAVWQRMSDDDVYEPLLPVTLPRTLLQFAAGAVLGRGPGTTSLLDTAPLRRTGEEVLRPDLVEANVATGAVDALGVVATRMPGERDAKLAGTASGRSVLFLDEHRPGGYAGNPDRALDVERGPVLPDHVLASSAIPVAFPPVRLQAPAGWYVDGGVRLNTPLHPAIGLGADRVVVVSATSTSYAAPGGSGPVGGTPDVADAAALVLHATLADRTTEDLQALRRTNRLVQAVEEAGRPGLLASSAGRAYRTVPVLAVSPPAGALARAAERIFEKRTRGAGRLAELDNWLLGQALRGAGDGVGRRELLSYLFFDEEYFAAGAALGRAAAEQALAAGWQL